MEDDGWEVCDLWHDVKKGVGKHGVRLSIHKECDYRQTYCITCGHSVKFYRIPANIQQQVQADSDKPNSLT